jgi:hypothetical protein
MRFTFELDFEGHAIGKLLVPLFVPQAGGQGASREPREPEETARERRLAGS